MSLSSPDSTLHATSVRSLIDFQEEVSAYKMEEAHNAIDGYIAELEAQIRALKSLRNRKAHISSLPTEILSSILTEVVRPLTVFEAASWEAHVELSSVCHMWRQVALQCPSFWSCIPITQCKHLGEMLARSKSHPLSIRLDNLKPGYANYPFPTLSDKELAALMSPRQVHQFHARGSESELERFLQVIPTEVSRLDSLVVELVGSTFSDIDALNPPIPLHILSRPKPALRHLQLYKCAVDWESFTEPILPFGNLIDLSLNSLEPRLPHHLLIGLLNASPQIQTVKLVSAIADDSKCYNGNAENTVFLPCLTHYTVWESYVTVLNHQTWLSLPSDACLDFQATSSPSAAKESSEFILKLLSLFGLVSASSARKLQPVFNRKPRETPLRSLLLDFGGRTIKLFLGESRSVLSDNGYLYKSFNIRLELLSTAANSAALLQGLSILGLMDARIQLPDYTQSISTSVWRAFFHKHPDIEHLIIEGDDIHEVISALGYSDEFSQEDRNSPRVPEIQSPAMANYVNLSLPLLKSLTLEGAILGPGTVVSTDGPREGSSRLSLLDICLYRRNYGLPAPLITVSECAGFNDKMAELIEEVLGVGQVNWDGASGLEEWYPYNDVEDDDEDYYEGEEEEYYDEDEYDHEDRYGTYHI